jgi:DNA-binding transcriptional MerR regulator
VKTGTKDLYRAKEFASLAGVTVRALHYYDRLGLLRPKQRSLAGYRLYGMHDFARLEQIVVLKFLGMPLKQIQRVLHAESDLGEALRRQQKVLEEKRRQLDRAIGAISTAQGSVRGHGEPNWKLFQTIVREIEMQNRTDWTNRYYSPGARKKVEQRRKLWSPELQERVTREWAQLFADVETALGEDPASPEAQTLAARWKKLVEEFTGGDPEVQQGLNKMYADQSHWQGKAQQAYAIKPEIMQFIMKAMQVHK